MECKEHEKQALFYIQTGDITTMTSQINGEGKQKRGYGEGGAENHSCL